MEDTPPKTTKTGQQSNRLVGIHRGKRENTPDGVTLFYCRGFAKPKDPTNGPWLLVLDRKCSLSSSCHQQDTSVRVDRGRGEESYSATPDRTLNGTSGYITWDHREQKTKTKNHASSVILQNRILPILKERGRGDNRREAGEASSGYRLT